MHGGAVCSSQWRHMSDGKSAVNPKSPLFAMSVLNICHMTGSQPSMSCSCQCMSVGIGFSCQSSIQLRTACSHYASSNMLKSHSLWIQTCYAYALQLLCHASKASLQPGSHLQPSSSTFLSCLQSWLQQKSHSRPLPDLMLVLCTEHTMRGIKLMKPM